MWELDDIKDKRATHDYETLSADIFSETRNRDIQENPDRYLSSYDLEKRRRETQHESSRKDERNQFRGNEKSYTPSKDKINSVSEKRKPLYDTQAKPIKAKPQSRDEIYGNKQKPISPGQNKTVVKSENGIFGKTVTVGGKAISLRFLLIGMVAVILLITAIVAASCIGKDKTTAVTDTETQSVGTEEAYTDIFEDTLFFGNSYFITLKTYDVPQSGHFLCKVGLSINQALEFTGDDDLGVIDVIQQEGYGHIVLAFGENELGWSSVQTFMDEYAELIGEIRKASPDMEIYVLSVLPVSAEVSNKDEDNTNNARIREFNEYIRIMAEENDVIYVSPTAELYDSELNLRSEDSTDGVHLSYEYTKIWVDDLKAIMERNEQ